MSSPTQVWRQIKVPIITRAGYIIVLGGYVTLFRFFATYVKMLKALGFVSSIKINQAGVTCFR